eukprot:s1717_g2.t1
MPMEKWNHQSVGRIRRMLGVEFQMIELRCRKYQNSVAPQRIPSVSDNAHDELLTVSKCAKHATLDG